MKGTKDFYNKTASEWANKWYEDEMKLYSLGKFNFVKELLFEKESSWKYYIFQKCTLTN